MLVLRISTFIVLLLLTVFAPWFLVVVAALVAAAVFPWFWENIVIGFLLGSIYGFSGGGSLLFAFLASGFTASFLVEEYSKRLIEGKNALSYALIVFSGGIAIFLFWLAFKIAVYI